MQETVRKPRRFEPDINRVIGMFNEIIESITPLEFESNPRLCNYAKYVGNQLRLCQDLAESLDDWVKDR